MKKLIIVFTAFFLAMAGEVSAQQFIARLTTTGNQPIYLVEGAALKEGQNTVVLPGAIPMKGEDIKATISIKRVIKFVKTGDSFSNVVFLDSLGKAFQMNPARSGSNGVPTPECKSKLPDACFSTADKNIGMCICRPGDISSAATIVVTTRTITRLRYLTEDN